MNAFGNAKHVARIGTGLEQDRKFVATEAGEDHLLRCGIGRGGKHWKSILGGWSLQHSVELRALPDKNLSKGRHRGACPYVEV